MFSTLSVNLLYKIVLFSLDVEEREFEKIYFVPATK